MTQKLLLVHAVLPLFFSLPEIDEITKQQGWSSAGCSGSVHNSLTFCFASAKLIWMNHLWKCWGGCTPDLLPSFYFKWNGISMKLISMSEVMPELTSRHERSALKTHVLLLKFPGQQKAKQRARGLHAHTHTHTSSDSLLLPTANGLKEWWISYSYFDGL